LLLKKSNFVVLFKNKIIWKCLADNYDAVACYNFITIWSGWNINRQNVIDNYPLIMPVSIIIIPNRKTVNACLDNQRKDWHERCRDVI